MNLRCASLTRNVTSYPYEFVGDFFFKHDARQIDAVAGLAFGVGLTSSVSVVIGRCLSLQWFGGQLDVILFYFCSVTARKSMAQRDVHGATCILSKGSFNKYDYRTPKQNLKNLLCPALPDTLFSHQHRTLHRLVPLVPFSLFCLFSPRGNMENSLHVLLSVTCRCLQDICFDCTNVMGRKEMKFQWPLAKVASAPPEIPLRTVIDFPVFK